MGELLVLFPLAGAVGCILLKKGLLAWALASAAFTFGAVVTAVLHVFQHGPLRFSLVAWRESLGIHLHMDGLSTIFLLLTGVVGILVSLYSWTFFSFERENRRYWPVWLLLWAGLNSLFMVSDIFSAYVVLELVTLCAAALAVLSGKAESLAAALRYLMVAMAGSLAFLLGVGLLYAEAGQLNMFYMAGNMDPGPQVALALGLMTAGLLIKCALLPFHFWFPLAHGEAYAPVSAILSALMIKGSFYLLLRLWVYVFDPTLVTLAAAQVLGALGVAAVLWGSYQAILQNRLKMIVAYSSVGQMGYLFLLFPLVCAAPDSPWSIQAWTGGIYQVVSHGLAKASMCLAAGNLILAAGTDRINNMRNLVKHLPMTTFALGLAGLSLMGLPPSGGFVAKWMLLQAILASGQWWWAVALVLGKLLAAGYVFRILGHTFVLGEREPVVQKPPFLLEKAAMILALLAIIIGFRAEEIIFLLEARTILEIPGGTD